MISRCRCIELVPLLCICIDGYPGKRVFGSLQPNEHSSISVPSVLLVPEPKESLVVVDENKIETHTRTELGQTMASATREKIFFISLATAPLMLFMKMKYDLRL